jgi:hypothetical protein
MRVNTPEVSRVQFPVRAVPVARKLSTVEERRQDKVLFVSMRRLRKRRPQPRQPVLSSIPGEGGFCSSETKHDRRTAPRQSIVCLE